MQQNSEEPLYRQMQKFYIGTKTFSSKYSLKKQYLTYNFKKGLKIFHICLTPLKTVPKASILISHGLGEHGSRYIQTAIRLADQGITTYMHDFRGFGHSCNGPHFTSFQELMEDIVSQMGVVNTDVPLFLMGHSMGGGTTLQLLRKNPRLKIAGVILHNPHIKLSPQLKFSAFDLKLVLVLPRLMELLFFTGRDCSPHILVKSDQALDDFYNDKFFTMTSTCKMLKTLIRITNNLFVKVNNNVLDYPCLGILGSLDRLTPPSYFEEYFKIVKCKDLSVKNYEKGFHDVIHDEEGEQICRDIGEWVNARIEKAPKFEKCKFVDVTVEIEKNWIYLKLVFGLLLAVIFYLIFK